MARFRRVLSVVLPLFAVAACSGKDPYNPGDPVGAFHVSAKLVSSTCGPTPNPWEFDVKLRHDLHDLYWVQGGTPVKGTVDASAHATLKTSDSRTLRDADPKTKLGACVVSRTDVLDVTLAKGNVPATDVVGTTSVAGTLVYQFAPVGDSDCSDQLLSTGGDYEALPCEIHYDLSAQRTGDLKQ